MIKVNGYFIIEDPNLYIKGIRHSVNLEPAMSDSRKGGLMSVSLVTPPLSHMEYVQRRSLNFCTGGKEIHGDEFNIMHVKNFFEGRRNTYNTCKFFFTKG